jgi:hypothetical protein
MAAQAAGINGYYPPSDACVKRVPLLLAWERAKGW